MFKKNFKISTNALKLITLFSRKFLKKKKRKEKKKKTILNKAKINTKEIK